MEISLKPLFPEGDETEADSLAIKEAARLCKDEIQTYITAKRPYTTGDIIHAMWCKCYEVKKPSLPFEEISRLARLYAHEAGWRVRTIDLRDGTTALHYPTERTFRAWLQENVPHAMEIAVRRPTGGKLGRDDTTADIAAYANERWQKHMRWKDICSVWKREHPADLRAKTLTSDKVREAWRRHYGDKRRESPSSCTQRKE